MKHHSTHTNHKKSLPLSAVILVTLVLSTFLTVFIAGQQQQSRSKAQNTEPIQQACLPDTALAKPDADKIEPFCTQFSDAGICKDFCKRTSRDGADSDSALCQPGGVYHCEAGPNASGSATTKGICQQGACATSPRTGLDSYCGGGGTCCEPPHPLGGACTKKEDCVAGLVCTDNLCSNPPPPPGPAQDVDGDGKQNDQDDDIDGDGIPNAQDPDIDGDRIPNDQDPQRDGAPGAVPPPPAPNPGGGAPNPGGGGAPNPGGGGAKTTCASVKGTCKARSACTGTVRTGLCPGGADNICCIGGGGGGGNTRCTSDAQCKSKNATYVCQNGTCRAPGCTRDAQCKSKNATWVCQNGTCRAPSTGRCRSNADCKNPSYPVCDVNGGACRPRGSGI